MIFPPHNYIGAFNYLRAADLDVLMAAANATTEGNG